MYPIEAYRTPSISLTIADNLTGCALFRITLEVPRIGGPYSPPMPPPSPLGACTDAPLDTRPVAGRIEAAPSDLQDAIEKWCRQLAVRNKRPDTVKCFARDVQRAARERGWNSCGDLTYESITDYLADRVEAGWSPATHNRALCAFRSFTSYLVAIKRLPDNPLELAARALEDKQGGRRALTTEEASRLLLTTARQTLEDGRSTAHRALMYYACLMIGLRMEDELPALVAAQVRLDDPVPHVHWLPSMHKSRREMFVALHPSMVLMFLRLRAAMKLQPSDRFFAELVHRPALRRDRDRAGIPEIDARNRRFGAHSMRKWFDTSLSLAGVADEPRKFLMRHSLDLGQRYLDVPLGLQREMLTKLPDPWPAEIPLDRFLDLTIGPTPGHHVGTTPVPTVNLPASPSSTSSSPPEWFPGEGDDSVGLQALSGGAGLGRSAAAEAARSVRKSLRSGNGHSRT